MARHLIYGQVLESAIPLAFPPAFVEPHSAGLLGTCRFEESVGAVVDLDEVNWFHQFSFPDDCPPWLSVGRCGNAHIFHFNDGPCFRVHDNGTRIEFCRSESDTEPDSQEIELLLLNQLLPLTIAHRGATAFHAAAIEFPQGAALFIGDSGAGKSTLARHLATEGLRLLTDDCAVLNLEQDPPLVFSGYPAIRVFDESLDAQYRFRGKAFLSPLDGPFPFRPEPAPIAAVFQLQTNTTNPVAINIERLSVRDAQFALTRHAVRLDPGDGDRLRDEFATLAGLAERLPVFRLSYPHDKSLLPDICYLLQSHLEKSGDFGSEISSPRESHDVRPS